MSGFEGRLMMIEKNQDAFNVVMRQIIPDLLSWSIDQHETGQYFLKFFSFHKSHSSAGAGEGVVSAFVLAAAVFDSSPGDIIVIDEPELSLHPAIQKRVIALLEKYSSDRQIIVSTHSPYFITRSAIQAGCVIARTWDRKGAIELYQIQSDGQQSTLSKISNLDLNNPHAFGLDAKEVFFLDDNVLVFEGQEDVVLWPTVAGTSSSYQTYGWGAGGAGKIAIVLRLLNCLGFKRVAALYDSDRATDMENTKSEFPTYFIDAIPAADIRTKPALPAKNPKVGLLDEQYAVRQEFHEPLASVLGKLEQFMKAE